MTTPQLPAVTAVVPTHNRPELMRLAVQSIVDQAYAGPIDILVVFDACEPALPDVVTGPNRTLTACQQRRVGVGGFVPAPLGSGLGNLAQYRVHVSS